MIGALILLAVVLVLPLLLFFLLGERSRYLPSTWVFFRQSGSWTKALHGYFYGRWTR
ncbi:MAG: hypothetical protein HY822_12835, partial [Acidobacteria bacterium]|nr:hypothetical protein [Acidobacteriota bacterium]